MKRWPPLIPSTMLHPNCRCTPVPRVTLKERLLIEWMIFTCRVRVTLGLWACRLGRHAWHVHFVSGNRRVDRCKRSGCPAARSGVRNALYPQSYVWVPGDWWTPDITWRNIGM